MYAVYAVRYGVEWWEGKGGSEDLGGRVIWMFGLDG